MPSCGAYDALYLISCLTPHQMLCTSSRHMYIGRIRVLGNHACLYFLLLFKRVLRPLTALTWRHQANSLPTPQFGTKLQAYLGLHFGYKDVVVMLLLLGSVLHYLTQSP